MAEKQLHDIDGRKMTVDEIAAMLGTTKTALYRRKSTLGGCSYQLIVNMCRDNRIGGYNDRHPRHLVDGQWITTSQAAAMLGVRAKSISQWRGLHRDAAGNLPTMEAAIAHFRYYKRYGRKRRVGEAHSVKGKPMTVPEAAMKYGVTDGAIYMYMRKHHCSLETYIRRLEKRRIDKAVKDIVGAIFGGVIPS